MKAVIQRVKQATVTVDGRTVGHIDAGLLVYVGFTAGDGVAQVEYMVDRVRKMRIFADGNDKMNLSVGDIGGAVLWVPNFTLYANTDSRRPSFSAAMPFADAQALFNYCLQQDAHYSGGPAQSGIFGADMEVSSVAWGPVNIVVER